MEDKRENKRSPLGTGDREQVESNVNEITERFLCVKGTKRRRV